MNDSYGLCLIWICEINPIDSWNSIWCAGCLAIHENLLFLRIFSPCSCGSISPSLKKKKSPGGACFQIQGVRTLLSPESGGYLLQCRSVVLNHCNMSPKAAWSPINTLWHLPACRQAQRPLLILYFHAFILPTVSEVSMEIHSYISKIAHNGPLTMTFFKQQTAPRRQSPSPVPRRSNSEHKAKDFNYGKHLCSLWPPVCIFFPSVPFFPSKRWRGIMVSCSHSGRHHGAAAACMRWQFEQKMPGHFPTTSLHLLTDLKSDRWPLNCHEHDAGTVWCTVTECCFTVSISCKQKKSKALI